ncbi:MAG: hypothetical protein LBB04_03510 [Oscillospiraceae bacterium]|jgi:hypothetical protein|nr:hypothetical protein [Oscillospiraceae bacterium]
MYIGSTGVFNVVSVPASADNKAVQQVVEGFEALKLGVTKKPAGWADHMWKRLVVRVAVTTLIRNSVALVVEDAGSYKTLVSKWLIDPKKGFQPRLYIKEFEKGSDMSSLLTFWPNQMTREAKQLIRDAIGCSFVEAQTILSREVASVLTVLEGRAEGAGDRKLISAVSDFFDPLIGFRRPVADLVEEFGQVNPSDDQEILHVIDGIA